MNLQYEIRICHKIHNKGMMSQRQVQVTIFLSGTDVFSKDGLNRTTNKHTNILLCSTKCSYFAVGRNLC